MSNRFTGVFKKSGKWYVAWVEELRGVNTQGRTLKEARKNLKEALVLILETNRLLSNQETDKKTLREPILVSAK